MPKTAPKKAAAPRKPDTIPKRPSGIPEYQDPGAKPEGSLKELLKWRQAVRRERRKVRTHLKTIGVNSRQEWEEICRQLGLSFEDDKLFLLRRRLGYGLKWLTTKAGLTTLLCSAAGLLGVSFLASSLTEYKGTFTINLTADMLKAGFVLSDTADFAKKSSHLKTDKIKELTNITLEDIAQNVDMIDGSHNGDNYLAYTFYIRNEGENPQSYIYRLTMGSSTKDVDEAVWILLFEDGRQLIYANKSADGNPEGLYGYAAEPPFYECCYNSEQYYQEDGAWGLWTTPECQDGCVAQGTLEDIQPGEYHKYTVVIWVEGYDPECTNDIFGGFAKYSLKFSTVGDEDEGGLFDGIYRTEYDDYAAMPA